jgi:hypothetical protein
MMECWTWPGGDNSEDADAEFLLGSLVLLQSQGAVQK